MALSSITIAIETAIRSIPRGRVATYGEVARAAGIPKGARQVARFLHSRSRVGMLPWWRVLGKSSNKSRARISLAGSGFEEQRALLISEKVEVAEGGMVDLSEFGWFSESATLHC